MPIRAKAPAALYEIAGIRVMAQDAVRVVKAVKVYQGGGLVRVFPAGGSLTATPDTDGIFGADFGAHPSRVTSTVVTVAVVGGSSPYSYSWSNVGGGYVQFTSPYARSTSVYRALFNETYSGMVRCTVTDALGSRATCDVTYELSHEASGLEP